MSSTAHTPRRFDWKSPWLLAGAAVLLIGGTLAVGLGTGMLTRGSQGGPAVVTSPTPSPSLSPSASPTPSGSPSPTTSVVARLHGKIAISNGLPAAGSGGWITFPGGTFTADPASDVRLPLLGDYYDLSYGLTHVKSLNKWVPVPRNAVSPDGLKYAYFDGTSFHVVRSGSSELLLNPPATSLTDAKWVVVTAEDQGLYVRCAGAFCASNGLWWLPYSGPFATIASSGYWTATDGRYAYGTQGNAVVGMVVQRLELSTGAQTTMFSLSGVELTTVGVAGGGRVVVLATPAQGSSQPGSAQIWLVGGGEPGRIYEGPYTGAAGTPKFAVYSVVADTMGTWIATSRGLYLYSPEGGLELASPVAGPLASAFRT